jgi:limonene-1,2-epoxide hydrolase
MTPTEVVRTWITRFNAADAEGLALLYAPDAVNHQVVMEPLHGRDAIKRMFAVEFGRAKMVCIEENLLESRDWAVLEWSDPLGLRGCGFFQIRNDQIVFQRGYFDQLTFFRRQGIPVPDKYLGDS